MKKRWFAILMSVMMLLGLLTGCGSARMSTAAANGAVTGGESENEIYAVQDETSGVPAKASTQTAYTGDEKLIYTGELDLQTTDLASAMQKVEQLSADCGGYLESSERYANCARYTVRVPQESFASFMNAAGEQADCRVTYQSTSTENVGEAYADLENRLETLQIKLERLQTLLTQAESMEDIITIESSVSDTESEIEQLSGQKKHYDSLIDFSTIDVTITQSAVLGEGENATFGQRLGAGFLNGLSNFGAGCAEALVWVVSHLLELVIVAAVVVAALLLIRRKRRNRAKKAANQTEK